MKRILIIITALVLLFVSFSCATSDGDCGNGHSYDVEGVTVLDLRGSWEEMGRQYGILAKPQMDDILSYLDRKLGTDTAEMSSAIRKADSLYANYPEYLKEFFKGVAGTSGLSPERVKLCNAVEYVEGLFQCSAMAVWGEYGKGGLVFGRNYDAVSYSEIDRDIVVTVYHPEDGIAAATIGYAGEIYCVNGLNAEGIFIELNNGMPSAGMEIHWDTCPSTTSLFNLLFTAKSLDDVEDFFRTTVSSLSVIIGVADSNEARSYEWCHDGVRRGDVVTEDGLMISTNHYVNGGWPYIVPDDGKSWNSITRRRNLAARAEEYKGGIDVAMMKKIMSASLGNGGPKHSPTRYQIVAVPGDLTLHINIPCVGKWIELDMVKYF